MGVRWRDASRRGAGDKIRVWRPHLTNVPVLSVAFVGQRRPTPRRESPLDSDARFEQVSLRASVRRLGPARRPRGRRGAARGVSSVGRVEVDGAGCVGARGRMRTVYGTGAVLALRWHCVGTAAVLQSHWPAPGQDWPNSAVGRTPSKLATAAPSAVKSGHHFEIVAARG